MIMRACVRAWVNQTQSCVYPARPHARTPARPLPPPPPTRHRPRPRPRALARFHPSSAQTCPRPVLPPRRSRRRAAARRTAAARPQPATSPPRRRPAARRRLRRPSGSQRRRCSSAIAAPPRGNEESTQSSFVDVLFALSFFKQVDYCIIVAAPPSWREGGGVRGSRRDAAQHGTIAASGKSGKKTVPLQQVVST